MNAETGSTTTASATAHSAWQPKSLVRCRKCRIPADFGGCHWRKCSLFPTGWLLAPCSRPRCLAFGNSFLAPKKPQDVVAPLRWIKWSHSRATA